MLNLKSLEITCKQCKTKITLDIGKTVIVCPLCNNAFYNSYDEAPLSKHGNYALLSGNITLNNTYIVFGSVALMALSIYADRKEKK